MNYKPQHFAAPDGTPLVVITREEYERLLAADEDDRDNLAADRALQDGGAIYPAEVVDAMLAGASPLAAWRAYRGLSQAELAKAAGLTQAAVSRLEKVKAGGAPLGRLETRRALARALDVPVAALEPLAGQLE